VHILTLGLNHKTAPVEVREKLAFLETAQQSALEQLVQRYGLREAAILSTCNRSEIYMAGETTATVQGAQRFLAEVQGVDVQALQPHFYELSDGDVAQHLFSVACGIDSLVIGESQILKQVREALELAQASGAARHLLNELFQRSLRVGKRARTETDIGRGQLSIGTAAVELAGQIFDRLEERRALLLGAGEMGELTAQYLVDSGIAELWVTNRTQARAEEVARRFGGSVVPFADFAARLEEIDIIISSTAAPGFVLGAEDLRQVMQRRRGRPLFLIDIAVPRDIDPQVRRLDNVFLFDIDDLEQVVASNRQDREQEIDKVRKVIDEELRDFLHWFKARGTGPLVRDLHRHAEDLRQVELERWMGKLEHLSEQDRHTVEALLQGYANKLLHQPLVQIRAFANEDEGHTRLDTVRRLFDLDSGAQDKKQVEP
jgi:glutamyl-tRNA reductase